MEKEISGMCQLCNQPKVFYAYKDHVGVCKDCLDKDDKRHIAAYLEKLWNDTYHWPEKHSPIEEVPFMPTKEGLCVVNRDGTGYNTHVSIDGTNIGNVVSKITIIIEPEKPINAILEVTPNWSEDAIFFDKIKPENVQVLVKDKE